ncbi:type IV secretory system conjugative DNA transfer family protein [Corynebacterium bovis]|uniref:type IV secretory system conjugative DNA transfer family protein n=2 Tax=Corynebacterium bovis TaxID=36808 RepID=UPI000F644918|nr:TraM recognition domain-containing protein [Corynebacterium bovis]
MSNVRNRREARGGQWARELFPFVAAAWLVLVWLVFWVGQHLTGSSLSANPLAAFRQGLETSGTTDGQQAGPRLVRVAGVWVSVGIAVVATAVVTVTAGMMARRRRNRPGASVRHATKNLASRADIAAMSAKSVAKSNAHINAGLPEWARPGQFIGRELATGQPVYLGYEDLTVDFWAARYGKTTGRILPALLDAPGAVVATGNKPDLVADSLGLRQAVGLCWVCDPQRIWADPADLPDFWIDPLGYIRRRPHDEWDAAAVDLTRLFAFDAGIDVGQSTSSAEWKTSGAALVSALLLAAAVSDRDIAGMLRWLYDTNNKEPLRILEATGWELMAVKAQATYTMTERTRDGVFFNARAMVDSLSTKVMQTWITPTPGVRRFDPDEFVASHEAGVCPTLYLLSDKRSAGSASALVLLLTVWVTEAAEDAGRRNGTGRLQVPLMMPLDEVANTVRWHALPDVYSHFGSKGIVISSVFQSFRQAKRIWGEDEAHDMMTNSTLIVGGGIKDEAFLREVSALVGEHEDRRVSRSSNSDSWSTQASVSHQEKTILSVAELRAMDAHLMLVVPQKHPPVIVTAEPYWARTYRPEIEAVRAGREVEKVRAATVAVTADEQEEER